MLIQDMCNLNTCAYKNKMHYSGMLFHHMGKKSMGSMLCNNCAHVVYFSVCKTVDGTQQKVIRSDQAHQYRNKIIIMIDCHYRARRIDL